MKKLLFTLFVAVAASFAVNAQTKIAHVNSAKLIDTMPSQKKATQELTFLQQKGVEEVKELETIAMKAINDYRALPADSPQSVKDYTAQKAQKAQDNYETRREQIEAQLANMSQVLDQKILASVKEAVKIVAARKGLNYVIDQSSALYASGTDITNEVISELLRIDAKNSAASTPAPAAAAGK